MKKLAGVKTIIFTTFMAAFCWWIVMISPWSMTSTVTIDVAKGANTISICGQLSDALRTTGLYSAKDGWYRRLKVNIFQKTIIWSAWIIRRLTAAKVYSGEYQFVPGKTLWRYLSQLTFNQRLAHKCTIPEGWTIKQIVQRINSLAGLLGEMIDAGQYTEGSVLPGTYLYFKYDSHKQLLETMRKDMIKLTNKLSKLPLPEPLNNFNEAITLASIVEREAAIAQEQPLIARVYLNRLVIGMPLQADPTIIYGKYIKNEITSLSYILSRKDLKQAGPFNTYLNKGLPPTPICCPGRSAINAVMNPESSKDLYFVATEGGKHYFSNNYKDHQNQISQNKRLKKKKLM